MQPIHQNTGPIPYPPTTTPTDGPTNVPARLANYRIREIVPKYQDVTLPLCAVSQALRRTGRIHCSEDVVALFEFLAWETRENFYALHLDTKHKILCLDRVSLGSLSSSIVHIRDVYKSALLSSAAAVIFVHNHPSGDPTPSMEDRMVQQRLLDAGELLGIHVLDHLIIGRDGAFESLAHPGSHPSAAVSL